MITDIEKITTEIVDAAVNLHMRLGPGLLEKVYEKLLANDLRQRGFSVERQKTIPFEFEGEKFDRGLTVDLLVNGLVCGRAKIRAKACACGFKTSLEPFATAGSTNWASNQFWRIQIKGRFASHRELLRTFSFFAPSRESTLPG